ncbi:MAG: hypothetical protein ACRDIL_14745 [Candidatus Limnocylindrales bacterium]
MTGPADQFRTRLLPALLSALGVTLLAAGLLTYTVPVLAEPAPSASPRPSPTAAATPSPLITLPPIGTATPALPTATPAPPADRVATRVRIKDLGIDLPVIKGDDGYPACNVAMYLVNPGLLQPGFGKATYLYAHAREGMFLPLLRTKSFDQRGKVVEVWTSDDFVFTYRITEVRREQTTLDAPLAAESEELWLQTSEGPRGTVGKTQVVAEPIAVAPADHAAAHPRARPVDCG